MNGIKRFLLIVISVSLSFLLQMIVFPRIPYLQTMPNMMLIETLSIGFLFGRKHGLLTGLTSGLLLDLMGTGIPGFYTLILSWTGYVDGILSEKMESELLPVLVVLFSANELVFHLYVFCLAFLVGKKFSLLPYIQKTFLPEALLSLILFMIVYGLLIYAGKRWDLKVRKGEVRVV